MSDEQQTQDSPFNEQLETSRAESLEARVQELEEQVAAAKDQSLRAAAELQNVRRRAEQDIEKAHKFALEKFSADLLSVVDTLERALEMSSPEDEAIKPMREGIELTLKMFCDTLRRHHLEVVDPHGEPFNPEHHQAMAMEDSLHLEPGSVVRVFQKGYLLSGRLLRPAMVVVSKAPEETHPSIDEKA